METNTTTGGPGVRRAAEREALTPVWQQARQGFAAHLARSTDLADATRDGYVKHVEWLARGVEHPWRLTTAELEAWLDGHNWSHDTRRKVLVSLRTFYAWAVGAGLLEWAPTAGLPAAEARSGPARLVLPPAWREPVEDFLAFTAAAGRAVGTLDQRRWWLGRLSEVAANPWTVTTQRLALFLSTPDWSPATKRVGRSSVRAFYRWAVLVGHLSASPAEGLDSVRIPRGLPRPAPTEAVRLALAGADERARLAVMLGALAGLRRMEIAAIAWADVSHGEVRIVGKGGHVRRVPLHPDLMSELAAHRSRQSPRSEWVFPSSMRGRHLTPAHLGKLVAEALPGDLTSHTLRHRFATAAYEATRDLRAVQELLGHAKPETTARYAAVPDGALSAAVAAVGI